MSFFKAGAEDIHAIEARRDRYLDVVKAAKSEDDIRDLGREIIFNRERLAWAKLFASQGVGNANKILAASEKLKLAMATPPAIATKVSGSHMSKDEREISSSCGSAERAYLARLNGQTLMTRTLPGIPHSDYRVMVMAAAQKLSPNPSTKEFALAKAQVDKKLVDQGLGVVIPHAKPGRVTR